ARRCRWRRAVTGSASILRTEQIEIAAVAVRGAPSAAAGRLANQLTAEIQSPAKGVEHDLVEVREGERAIAAGRTTHGDVERKHRRVGQDEVVGARIQQQGVLEGD